VDLVYKRDFSEFGFKVFVFTDTKLPDRYYIELADADGQFLESITLSKRFFMDEKEKSKLLRLLRRRGFCQGNEIKPFLDLVTDFGRENRVNIILDEEDDTEITSSIVWDSTSFKLISPGQNIIDGVYYTQVSLYAEEYKEVKSDSGESTIIKDITKRPYFVTSEKELILVDQQVLQKYGLYLTSPASALEVRWLPEYIKTYLDNEAPEIEPVFVYRKVKEEFKKYIDFVDPAYYDIVTLWVMGTYVYAIFNTYPYLFLTGTKNSGKTKTLQVMQYMCYNAIMSNNLTGPTIFRITETFRPTLLLDEQELLSHADRADIVQTILNSGYKKSSKAHRLAQSKIKGKETYKIEEFELFCPKVIANITGMEEVLESRTIPIHMFTTLDPSKGNADPLKKPEGEKAELRNFLYLFSLQHWKEIKKRYDNFDEIFTTAKYPHLSLISNRNLELWKPIITLASMISEKLIKEIIDVAANIITMEKELEKIESFETKLLMVLDSFMLRDKELWIKVKDIRDRLIDYFYAKETNERYYPSPRKIKRILVALGFSEMKRKGGNYIHVLIRRKDLDEAMRRFGLVSTQGEVVFEGDKFVKPNGLDVDEIIAG